MKLAFSFALLVILAPLAGCTSGEKTDEEVAAARNDETPQGTISDNLPNPDLLPGDTLATPIDSAGNAAVTNDETGETQAPEVAAPAEPGKPSPGAEATEPVPSPEDQP